MLDWNQNMKFISDITGLENAIWIQGQNRLHASSTFELNLSIEVGMELGMEQQSFGQPRALCPV